MITKNYLTLTPAYGRDYASKAKAKADFDSQKDFIESQSGRYVNKQQFEAGTKVNIRYGKLRKVAVFTA